MFAIIKTGGKQYKVSPRQKIKVEKLDVKEGGEVEFNQVLLMEKDQKTEIGTPFVSGVKVFGKVLKQGKTPKVIVFKYKSKTRRRKKKGHKQFFSEVEITRIETGGK